MSVLFRKKNCKRSTLSGLAFDGYFSSHGLYIAVGEIEPFTQGALAMSQAGVKGSTLLEELILLLARKAGAPIFYSEGYFIIGSMEGDFDFFMRRRILDGIREEVGNDMPEQKWVAGDEPVIRAGLKLQANGFTAGKWLEFPYRFYQNWFGVKGYILDIDVAPRFVFHLHDLEAGAVDIGGGLFDLCQYFIPFFFISGFGLGQGMGIELNEGEGVANVMSDQADHVLFFVHQSQQTGIHKDGGLI